MPPGCWACALATFHVRRGGRGAFDNISYTVQSVAQPARGRVSRGLLTPTGDGPPNITVLQIKAREEGSNLLFIGFIWGAFSPDPVEVHEVMRVKCQQIVLLQCAPEVDWVWRLQAVVERCCGGGLTGLCQAGWRGAVVEG